MVIGFLFRNKVFKSARTEVAVLSLRDTFQAYLENKSMTFKRHFCLTLYFEREIQFVRSVSQISSIFVIVYVFRGYL
jgi:hypothetical protein